MTLTKNEYNFSICSIYNSIGILYITFLGENIYLRSDFGKKKIVPLYLFLHNTHQNVLFNKIFYVQFNKIILYLFSI